MLSRIPLIARGFGAAGRPQPGGGEQRTPIFFSDWRTVTPGNSTAAISDGGKWDDLSAAHQTNGEIITAASISTENFPTLHVLKSHSPDPPSQSGWLGIEVTTLDELTIGVPRNYRWYFSNREPIDSNDNHQHPVQDGGSGQNWGFATRAGPFGANLENDEWGASFAPEEDPYNPWGPNINTYTPLQKALAYHIDFQWVRINSTECRGHGWIRDWQGNLVLDDTTAWVGPTVTLADSPLLTFPNMAGTTRFNCGCNGLAGPYPYYYANEAGFAVVDGLEEEEEIGAYGMVVGEVLP